MFLHQNSPDAQLRKSLGGPFQFDYHISALPWRPGDRYPTTSVVALVRMNGHDHQKPSKVTVKKTLLVEGEMVLTQSSTSMEVYGNGFPSENLQNFI